MTVVLTHLFKLLSFFINQLRNDSRFVPSTPTFDAPVRGGGPCRNIAMTFDTEKLDRIMILIRRRFPCKNSTTDVMLRPRIGNDCTVICSVCSLMTLFNELNLNIVKLILYDAF